MAQSQEVDSSFESSNIQSTLQRWEEESAALDGPAVHLVAALFKEQLVEHLTPIYEQETKPKEATTQRLQGSTTLGSTRGSGQNQLSVPHTSDQATPSSPRGETSVDQLRSSLRQVADALAQTVAAVRNTREQLRDPATIGDSSQEVNNMEEEEEEGEGGGGDIEFADDPDPNLFLPYTAPPPIPPRPVGLSPLSSLPPLPPLPLPADHPALSSSTSPPNPPPKALQGSDTPSGSSGAVATNSTSQHSTTSAALTSSSSSFAPLTTQSSGGATATAAVSSFQLPTPASVPTVSLAGETATTAATTAVSSFDGSQESARATLEQTDPQDPLYTFLSAYVGAPPPPIAIETPSTTASSAGVTQSQSEPHTQSSTPPSQPPVAPSTSTSSPRLPVFTQMQQSLRTQERDPSGRQGQATLPSTPSLNPATPSNVQNTTAPQEGTTSTTSPLPPSQPSPATFSALSATASQVNDIASMAESIASQVTSFFQSNPFDQSHSSQDLDDTVTLANSLARQLSRTASQLVPTSGDVAPSQLTPTTTSAATPASSDSLTVSQASPTTTVAAGQSSPSPSDTLAPLISSLQMPTPQELLRRLEERRTPGPVPNMRVTDEEQQVEPPTSHTGENIVDTESASMISGTLWQQVGEVLPQSSGEGGLLESAGSVDVSAGSPGRTGGNRGGSGEQVSQENTMDDEEESATVGASASGATATNTASEAATANMPPTLQQLPDTIDHEVLAALPDSMQQEILAQHAREQRARQAQREGFATTISPEFLSALPTNIQEEVSYPHSHDLPFASFPSLFPQLLQQERAEQARQRQQQQSSGESGTATASASVDNTSFFHNLAPELRRTILADLDDSVISHLPDEVASEARALRQERETRRRQILEQRHAVLERIFEQANTDQGGGGGYVQPASWDPSSYRYAILNLNPHQVLDGHHHHHHHLGRLGGLYQNLNSNLGGSQQGGSRGAQSSKQMLDQEALTCLLVLLFFDQNKLHNNRLHRIVKNLSQHASTRAWIISSLLSILHKASPSVRVTPGSGVSHTCPLPPPLTSRQQASGAGAGPIAHTSIHGHHSHTPHWLNLTINAALGSHTHVFQFQPSGKVGSNPDIHVHSLASLHVCNNVLDLLVFLSRQFPTSFLPSELMPADKPSGGNGALSAAGPSSGSSKQVSNRVVSNFWQILVRLDGAASRKGKGLLKGFLFQESTASCSAKEIFTRSVIGQLMTLLQESIVRDSVSLTDKLLRVLSVASGPIPKSGLCRRATEVPPGPSGAGPSRAVDSSRPGSSTQSMLLIPAGAEQRGGSGRTVTQSASSDDVFVVEEEVVEPSLLQTVISVLTSGLCSEDGLEDATLLLTNLSKCSVNTRENILIMLLDGIRTIGLILSSQIIRIIDDLYAHWKRMGPTEAPSEEPQHGGDLSELPTPAPGASKKSGGAPPAQAPPLGNVISGVVLPTVNPDSVVDHSKDLHLPSMIPLTCKGSQQSFFLRMLKVVCQLRESAKAALQGTQKTAGECFIGVCVC